MISVQLPYICFFLRVTKFAKMGEMCNYFICVSHFFNYNLKKFLIAIEILRCKIDKKKPRKLDHPENYLIYGKRSTDHYIQL